MRTIGALGLTAAVAAGADARSTMGYNAFRPWQSPAAQDCVYEDFGGARNDCPDDKTLVFETVVDNAGWHWIQAVSLGNGRPFDCYAQSYAQAAYTQDTGKGRQAFNGTGGQLLTFWANVNPGGTLRLVCENVPFGEGILSLNWNP